MPISYKHKIYIPAPDIQNANMRANYPVKSQISVNYKGTNLAFDVLDYDKHDLVDTDTAKTMCVCSHDIISYGTMPFCAPQLMYWSENGLPAGTYKLTLDHAQYGGGTLYDGTYMFTLTKAIPADGGFRHTKPVGGWQSSYEKADILGNYIYDIRHKTPAKCHRIGSYILGVRRDNGVYRFGYFHCKKPYLLYGGRHSQRWQAQFHTETGIRLEQMA